MVAISVVMVVPASRDLQVSSQDIGFQINEISDQDEVEEILVEGEPGEQSK